MSITARVAPRRIERICLWLFVVLAAGRAGARADLFDYRFEPGPNVPKDFKPGPGVDASGLDLSGSTFVGMDLSGANFDGANLRGTAFFQVVNQRKPASFRGADLVAYDREGNDWDATITKIVDNPISIRQAFWSPYKRIGRMIGDQIQKFAAARDKAVEDKAAAGVADAGAKVEAPAAAPAAPAAPFDIAKFAGIFAAIGLALGAIGTAVATVLGGFMSLPLWQMPLAIAGIILFISGPSMLMAYMKLRQRNLGPILDACGWAVNTKASINRSCPSVNSTRLSTIEAR